ncbi:MAG: aspartyl/asparaginyl beta-hydroxylase domain-containing protein [Flavobacteriales bacterium]|nr:aspartyl/asparaginyl beta-hydroxylase domain-containing protein [Flavobacteriales bacterium]
MKKKSFYNVDSYDFLSEIRSNYALILEELESIIDRPIEHGNYSTWIGERPDYLSNPVDKSVAWKTLTFRIFGIDYLPNKEHCPTIAFLIDKYPFIVTAEFSLLEPETHIFPHKGFTGDLLRSHLGLKIPKGDAAIKVGDNIARWKDGEIIVFDDSVIHEAWNKTVERRVVFMFDFEPSLSECRGKEVCKEVLSKTNDKHLMGIAPREQWLDWLEKGYFYL